MSTGPSLRDERSSSIVATCSEPELFEPIGDIAVLGMPEIATLKVSDTAARARIIEAVRAGKHVEVQFRARVWRQRDGSPNKNFYRIAPSKAAAWATSFTGKPFLVDHRSWAQDARKGTILSSELVQQAHNWIAMVQEIRAVKPDAVISVLDGTIDRFSVGWSRNGGAVICTVHGKDRTRRGSCDCWPGDRVIGDDGKEHVVEFEWQTPEGTETSGVNTPAVGGTRIEEIRAALSAELGLDSFHRKDNTMKFAKLAAVLGLNALAEEADEDRAVRAVEQLRAEKEAAEEARNAALERATKAEGELAAVEAERTKQAQLARKARVDALIEQALSDGRLLTKRDEHGKPIASRLEEVCRKMGMEQGEDVLSEYLAGLPRLAPIGDRVVRNNDPQPPKNNSPIPSGVLSSTARQLGLDPTELDKAATELAERG